jgi:type II secretory pathway pseudopilin PulG
MSAMNARAMLDAWIRGWTVRAQLELYKNDHGDYPASLSDAGVTELDPFTGGPFVYRVYPGDFTLYSVGMNRGDNDADPIQDRDLVLHRATAEPELITPIFNQELQGMRRSR